MMQPKAMAHTFMGFSCFFRVGCWLSITTSYIPLRCSAQSDFNNNFEHAYDYTHINGFVNPYNIRFVQGVGFAACTGERVCAEKQ